MADDDRRISRELSPWSARRALTMGKDANVSPRARRRSRSMNRDTGASAATSRRNAPPAIRRRSRSNSVEKSRTSRERSLDPKPTSSKRAISADSPPKSESGNKGRARETSPEPYRSRHGDSRSKRRDHSLDRKRDRSRDKRRDDSRERTNERSRERRRDRSRDRHRDHRRHRSRDRKRDRSRRRSRSKDRKPSSLPSRSSHKHRTRSRSLSRSRSPKRRRHSPSQSRSPVPRSRKPLPTQEISFRGLDDSSKPPTAHGGAPPEREKPNFKPTGLLAREANKVEGTKISLKYHEPPEARKPSPSSPWTLSIFKGDDYLGKIELGSQSCWLFGRAREVADVQLEHPSASSQHAVIQFRYIQKMTEDEYGVKKMKGKVKPYLIDLESSNGTELNDEDVEAGRYLELRDKDIIRFGASEREYVVMLPPKE